MSDTYAIDSYTGGRRGRRSPAGSQRYVQTIILPVVVMSQSMNVSKGCMFYVPPLHNLALYRPLLPISKSGTTAANSKSRARINPNGLKFQYDWNSPAHPFG